MSRGDLQYAAYTPVVREMLSEGVCVVDMWGHWTRTICMLLGGLLLTGCALMPGTRAGRDVLSSFDPAMGFVFLEAENMRAVIQPDENAAVVVTKQDGADPLLMEILVGAREAGRPENVYADRLVIGVSGDLDVVPSAWQMLDKRADGYVFHRDVRLQSIREGTFPLSVQREVSLLGRSALHGFLHAPLPDGVQVSGYASGTVFLNPGPLPWPRSAALPHIRIEGDLVRSQETLLLLHVRPGGENAMMKSFGKYMSFVDTVFMGRLMQAEERHVVLLSDYVLPRIALLDPENRVLTLIAYTPLVGALGMGDADRVRSDLELVITGRDRAGQWIRVISSGAALPLATGGSTRHQRQTFHVRGTLHALFEIAAAFCRLPHDDVLLAFENMVIAERD